LSSGLQTVGDNFQFIKVSGLPSETKTVNDLFARIELEFDRTYYQYVRILQMIVQVPEKTAAHELFELFFAVEIEPRLALIAQFLWQNRARIKIKDIEPMAALFRFRNTIVSARSNMLIPLTWRMFRFRDVIVSPSEGFKEAASEYTIGEVSDWYRQLLKAGKTAA